MLNFIVLTKVGATAGRINPSSVRCFYPRRDEKPGSRLVFTDGGGYAVNETPAEIDVMMLQAGVRFVHLTKIVSEYSTEAPEVDEFSDSDEDMPEAEASLAVITSEVRIQPSAIRNYFERHAERGTGTRLTFTDGGAFAVTELVNEVDAAIATALQTN